jgi:predicted membrane channel-forming protein YqfA (hemolysin III family)
VALAQTLYDKLMRTICGLGITLAVVGLFAGSLFIHTISDLLFVVFAFSGLLLVVGLTMFIRYRNEIRTIAKLLNDA